MASQGMILRNMNLVGGHSGRVDMPEELKKTFEEGCYLIFMRWTALQLAIHNEWGGSESKAKAKSLFEEVVEWFYTTKGMSSVHDFCSVSVIKTMTASSYNNGDVCADHEMSDLEGLLDEAIQVDFNVQAEDDSPYMVARSLVNMYHQVAHGDVSYVHTLREEFEKNGQNVLAKSMCDPGSFMAEGDARSESSSSSGDDDDDDDGMDLDESPESSHQPMVDDDGFQVVQRRGTRRH